jgi:hypothetical protein
MTPDWILDIFAAIMLVVAAVSAARLVAARPWQRGSVITDTDVSHLLMGIAMAGMLAPGLATLPNGAWAVVFGVLAVWFGYRVVRDYQASGTRALAAGHCAPHLAHSAAMLYMFLAIMSPAAGGGSGMAGMADMGGMSGMGALHVPTLGFVFALILIGYTIWDLDQLSGLRYGLAVAVAGAAAPALASSSAGTVGAGTMSGSDAGGGGAAATPAGSGEAGGRGSWGGGRSAGMPIAILDSPGTVVGCRIAMGVTMALMLILLL